MAELNVILYFCVSYLGVVGASLWILMTTSQSRVRIKAPPMNY